MPEELDLKLSCSFGGGISCMSATGDQVNPEPKNHPGGK